jgi:hypothetical protein
MIAIAYLGLGDYNKVLQWAEKACSEQDAWRIWLLMTMFEPMHKDQRFLALLKKFEIYNAYRLMYEKPTP